jgi:hypothetical protein
MVVTSVGVGAEINGLRQIGEPHKLDDQEWTAIGGARR